MRRKECEEKIAALQNELKGVVSEKEEFNKQSEN